MNDIRPHPDQDLTTQLVDEHGIGRTVLDFAALGCSPTLAAALKDVFLLESGHLRYETQRQAWRCVRKITLFLKQSGLASATYLPPDLLTRWWKWLSQQKLLPSTQQTAMNIGVQYFNAVARNHPFLVPSGLEQNVARFERQQPVKLRNLSKADLKMIMEACKVEILATETRMQEGRDALVGNHNNDDLVVALQTLARVQPYKAVSQKELLKLPRPTRLLVTQLGGLRYLNTYRFLTARDLIGFYIMLLAQTAGNPMAIRQLRRDCVDPHPLRSDLMRVVWEKPRANREQEGSFPINHRWSAPSLVSRLAVLNENLRANAPPGHADYLFLSQRNGHISLPIHQMFHILLDEFIEKYSLPEFDFKQLRPSEANLIFLDTGDIVAVQKKLNHRRTSTSSAYIETSLLEEHRIKTISKYQGQLIQLTRNSRPTPNDTKSSKKKKASPAETVFGFLCKDPLAGLSPGSVQGHVCENFNRCATCPGAVVTLDDPTVVAKLLSTHRHLALLGDKAVRQGWSRRFDALYRPTLTVIEQDLLPCVSTAVRKKAEHLIGSVPFPHLD